MQKTIQIDDDLAAKFTALCKEKGWPEDQAIKEAIDILLSEYATDEEIADRAFGMWKHKKIDALDFQRKLRAEWDDEGL